MTDNRTHRVAVIGAAGRMGATVCRAVDAASDLALVGRYDLGDDLGDLGGAEVVVEFSVPSASLANVVACVERGVHVVVGTTGWDEAKLSALRATVADHPGVGVLIAPNFAVGALLMMRFAREAARFYESVEVIELHHPGKVDAPSGTAARTAALVAAARVDATCVGKTTPSERRAWTPGFRRCPTRPRTTRAVPGGRRWTAYRCMRCVCGDWSRTRRCSSGPRGRR